MQPTIPTIYRRYVKYYYNKYDTMTQLNWLLMYDQNSEMHNNITINIYFRIYLYFTLFYYYYTAR